MQQCGSKSALLWAVKYNEVDTKSIGHGSNETRVPHLNSPVGTAEEMDGKSEVDNDPGKLYKNGSYPVGHLVFEPPAQIAMLSE